MSKRLSSKRCIVTGAAQGIGRASAELFLEEGAEVIAVDCNPDALATLRSCDTRVLDLLNTDAIAKFGIEVGRVDALFNCAGYVHNGTLLDGDDNGYRLSFDLNVHAITHMTRAVLPAMIAARAGSIVNMASVAGAVIGVANRYAYCATKAAVAGLTRAVALDYVELGIRCNAICPGTVQSPSLNERLAATGNVDVARAAFIARQPMGRIGRPEEIAALALYLVSDESTFTTGTLQVIDGGWSMA